MQLESGIEKGLKALSLDASDEIVEKSAAYLRLLEKWNRVTNLTAVRDLDDMVPHHLMDSFAVQPYLSQPTILDVGSGAGLPGIPLALLNPDRRFILLDTNGKKTRFMLQAKIELGLENVDVVQSRVEDFEGQFGHVITRAFRNLGEFAEMCGRLLTSDGSLLAMKGPDHEDEKSSLAIDEFAVDVKELNVPGMDATRYLVEVRVKEKE